MTMMMLSGYLILISINFLQGRYLFTNTVFVIEMFKSLNKRILYHVHVKCWTFLILLAEERNKKKHWPVYNLLAEVKNRDGRYGGRMSIKES